MQWFEAVYEIPYAQRGAQECVDLWLAIHSLDRDGTLPDVFTWPWSASGVFSVSSAYGMLTLGTEFFALAGAIWKSTATPKCKQFMWLSAKYRIWTWIVGSGMGYKRHRRLASFACRRKTQWNTSCSNVCTPERSSSGANIDWRLTSSSLRPKVLLKNGGCGKGQGSARRRRSGLMVWSVEWATCFGRIVTPGALVTITISARQGGSGSGRTWVGQEA
jgi:hypothetical protein